MRILEAGDVLLYSCNDIVSTVVVLNVWSDVVLFVQQALVGPGGQSMVTTTVHGEFIRQPDNWEKHGWILL